MNHRRLDLHPRPAFTLTDILVLLAVFLVILALVAQFGVRTLRGHTRVRCGNNLSQLARAFILYANENKGAFPRVRYDRALADSPTQYTGVNAADPFAADGPAPNDVTAAIFLLLRTQDISSEVLVCPRADQIPWTYDGQTVQTKSNFPNGAYLSYSIAHPYPGTAAVNSGYKWNNTLTAEFALAADMNPGSLALLTLTSTAPLAQMQQGNSLNHQRQGQNVLYADGHTEWQQNPFVGVQRDNIYTVSAGPSAILTTTAIIGGPSWAGDTVMLPVASPYPPLASLPESAPLIRPYARWPLIALAAILVFIPIRALYRRRHRRPAMSPPADQIS